MERSRALHLCSREPHLVDNVVHFQNRNPGRVTGTHLAWRSREEGYRSPPPVSAVFALDADIHNLCVPMPAKVIHRCLFGHVKKNITNLSRPATEVAVALITSN